MQKISSGKPAPMQMLTGDEEHLSEIVQRAQKQAKEQSEAEMPKQRTNISFDSDVHRAMRKLALDNGPDGASMNEICNRFCRDALKARGLLD
jgi:hypothetical protein